MKSTKFLIYANGRSENHGCEAIRRGSIDIFNLNQENAIITTTDIEAEKKYGLDKLVKNIEFEYDRKINVLFKFTNRVSRKLIGKKIFKGKYDLEKFVKAAKESDIAISTGGDNYCYGYCEWLVKHNQIALEQGCKTVLYGCSIEKSNLDEEKVVEDLKSFSLIVVRESLSYDNLVKAGINKNTKLYPDPAFVLNAIKLPLPQGFREGDTIGINISPMIIQNEKKKGACIKNYKQLIQHIIDTTESQIALIPHVVWAQSDDRQPSLELYNEFKDTGRIIMIDDHNSMELKGYIARCRIFIGARTHATISAYSSCVPTLVIGYSVKAKGIAKDIFGTYDNHVLPVQALENENDLINAFEWIKENEKEIRTHMETFMPEYKERARVANEEIKKLMTEN